MLRAPLLSIPRQRTGLLWKVHERVIALYCGEPNRLGKRQRCSTTETYLRSSLRVFLLLLLLWMIAFEISPVIRAQVLTRCRRLRLRCSWLFTCKVPWNRTAISDFCEKHNRFYIEDGNEIFLIEFTLFKIHRSVLQSRSVVFETMFSLIPPDNVSKVGNSDGNPIRLEGTSAIDFERLLAVLYPSDFRCMDLHTFDEWMSVIELATKYQMDDVREFAVEKATRSGSLAQRIVMARQYDLPDLLEKARLDICERRGPISLRDARLLGVDELAILCKSREDARGRRSACYTLQNVRALESDLRCLGTW
ncbi:uncharacterized protein LAESUDRAFT_715869 [Laetiporus sulphureus 93-53]|uniref:BTB domain-containing protein n=1 Tax=Laetiporus sulphureus 93-53 TaxID=1314785 RepID=A0A165D1C1_9APHY|nr:uncharacterized protein LAESUDRAFT_715869 [Laetiporus sulphureus 93-53]KZT03945.1 hypothetical protein LAESUDRAFT_715869 [Laetiporus sulphureus 93-53]